MAKSQAEEKLAVEGGYWSLYRFNPLLESEGKNPFQLDSKEPDWAKYEQFMNQEVRFLSLKKTFPRRARDLSKIALKNAKWRYDFYKRQASLDYSSPEE